MDKGNWIPIDKNAVNELPKNRTYTQLEAVFSLTVDIDNAIHKYTKAGKGSSEIPRTPDEAITFVMAHGQTISGYAALWGWSRGKVRTFMKKLRQDPDTNKTVTRHPLRFIINRLQSRSDSSQTAEGQALDTTNYPLSSIHNPKEKTHGKRKKPLLTDEQFFEYLHCNPAYKHINIETERSKCEAWCEVKGTFFSQRQFLSWLNRIDKPIGGNNGKQNYRTGSTVSAGRNVQPGSAGRNLSDGADYPIDCEVTE